MDQLRTKPLKRFALLLFVTATLQSRAESLVQSVDAIGVAGFYSLDGKTSTKRAVSLSGVGVYRGQIDVGFFNRLRASFGLAYLLSDGFTGDSAWGFEFGLKYFPMSWNGNKTQSFDGVSWILTERFRPYVGLNFKTMQFTTVLSTTYTGIGLSLGSHYSLNQDFYLVGEGQYNTLAGSNQNTLNEMYIMFGLGVRLK